MRENLPAIKKGVKTLALILFAAYLVMAVYVLAQYHSINAVEVSLSYADFDIGVDGPLDEDSVVEALAASNLEVEIELMVEGDGLLAFEVGLIQAQVYLGEVYLGEYASEDSFRVPAQGTETLHIIMGVEGYELGDYKMEQLVTYIVERNGEVEVSVKASMEPEVIIVPLTMIYSDSARVLSYNDGPRVTSLAWDSVTCDLGENASFTVKASNVFKYSNVTGVLSVNVWEDKPQVDDPVVADFSYPLSMRPGESVSLTGSFAPYLKDSTNGFHLTAVWGVDVINEQAGGYPPRLRVVEGDLQLLEVYWTVNGVRTSNCTAGDEVEAHIRLKAVNAGVDEDLIVNIKKDEESTQDRDILSQTHPTVLRRDEETEKIIEFTPSETSYPVVGGYYLELKGGVNWTMPEGSPPRLSVTPLWGNLTLRDAWWTKGERKISSAEKGDTVKAHITLVSIGGPYTGNIVVNIMRDHPSESDETIISEGFPVTLDEGGEADYTVSFTASEATGSEFRGYYITVRGGLHWEMNDSYPPRLEVSEPVIVSFPVVQSAWWSAGGETITVARQGEPVDAVVRVKSLHGRSRGNVIIHIRKEFRYTSDEDQTIRIYELDLGENEYVDIATTFTPEDQSGYIFVGYYIYVDFDSWGKSWTMNKSYPPRIEVI